MGLEAVFTENVSGGGLSVLTLFDIFCGRLTLVVSEHMVLGHILQHNSYHWVLGKQPPQIGDVLGARGRITELTQSAFSRRVAMLEMARACVLRHSEHCN